jgi:predicted MPP superfamily phosphohydrolase
LELAIPTSGTSVCYNKKTKTLMGIAAFLIVIQSIITFVHWVVWRTLDTYWPLFGHSRTVVFVLIIILSFSFLISNILTRLIPGDVTRVLYFYSAMWLGTVHFLFLAAVALSCMSLTVVSLGGVVSPWIVLIFCMGALSLNGFALWNGFQIHPKHMSVALPHLPDQWVGKKIAFFADSHFGNIHRQQTAQDIADLIEAEDPALILMGGDYFDGPPIPADLVTAPFQSLTKRIPAYFVSGNHEEYGDTVGFLQALESAGFHIINDKRVVVDGLQIVGLDFVTTRTAEATEMVMMHLMVNHDLPTIVLKHVPRNISQLAEGGAHLTLHGHTHEGQMWPFSWVTWLVYKGYDFGLKHFSVPSGEALVYTTSGAGSWGPPQRFGTAAEVVFFTLEGKP